ncbi:MAG: hypothetical protein JSV49_10770 [Thermoplasmata archaeon]|nr:MAG: hypothetical protein JSV49_10770 [Thermoplasmata archaeon]
MPQGILKLIQPNGDIIYIVCEDVPPADGTEGKLVINGVSRREATVEGGEPYKFISIPRTADDNLPVVDQENILEINLTEDVSEDHLILPYNGGVPNVEVSIKFRTTDSGEAPPP